MYQHRGFEQAFVAAEIIAFLEVMPSTIQFTLGLDIDNVELGKVTRRVFPPYF